MIPTCSPSKTILCIDDDYSILRFEKALLERSGYGVLTATSAQEGLKLATTCMCDAVVLEYQLPEMNGHQVASEIRLVRPNLVIVLLSGSEVPPQALAVVDAFVPKLESSKHLLPIIAALCSESGNTTQARTGGLRT